MNIWTRVALAFLVVCGGAGARGFAAPAADADGTVMRRFALIASANDGGPGRVRLRFAGSDARQMADVLRGLGGLREQDLVLLEGATRASLHASFDQLRARMAVSPPGHARRELFVYYSGHSDEEGLLLAGERVSYRELRQWIEAVGADVRIAILDSCASGALIHLKGGTHRPSFLSDVSAEARGHAFLTASSADEAAQESERIGAAFFTHYLVSGLRGAADTSHDGRVTLGEAYQFAYAETLRRTERTAAGAQHAAYDIQLAGTGDLVMTDLRATSAGLIIDDKIAGRLYVRDDSGRLLVELRKEPLYPVELGLGPGHYRVLLDADGRPSEAEVNLREGKTTRLAAAQFVALAPLVATARGGVVADEVTLQTTDTVPARVPNESRGGEGGYAAGTSSRGAWDPARVPNESRGGEGGYAAGTSSRGAWDPARVPNESRGGEDGYAAGTSSRGAWDPARVPSQRQYRHVPFELVLVQNVRTGGDGVQPVLNNLVLGAVGHSHALRGLQFSIGGNVVDDDMRGMQMALGFNLTRGTARGVQLTSGVNIALQDYRGVQLGDVGNVVLGDMCGAQLAMVGYTAGHLRGAQIGVATYVGKGFRGAQVGVATYAGGESQGAKLGVVNVANGSLRGVQLGVVNFAREVNGLQTAVANVAGTATGPQIAVVNVADHVTGLQLGVVNVARSVDGASVGLLNFVGDGYHRLAVWSGDLSPTNVGVKLGSHYVYSVLGFGLGRTDGNRTLMNAQGGIGGHAPLAWGERLFLDVDGVVSSFGTTSTWNDSGVVATLRAVVGFQVMGHLAITAGPTLNVNVYQPTDRHRPGLGFAETSFHDGDTTVRLFPGFVIGTQI